MVKVNSENFIFEIQRIVEQALVTYSSIDFRKDNFLTTDVKISNKNMIITLHNNNVIHSKVKESIKILIPYLYKTSNSSYALGGNVKIKL